MIHHISLDVLGYHWAPIDPVAAGKLRRVLQEWEDTPYMSGAAIPGEGVDCIHYGGSCMCKLRGWPVTKMARLPQDFSMNNRLGAMRVMHQMRRTFPAHYTVRDGVCPAGSVMIVAPTGGGPGHWRFVGADRNTIWEAGALGVQRYGWSLDVANFTIVRVYAFSDMETWV
jgi:hypothetical protein